MINIHLNSQINLKNINERIAQLDAFLNEKNYSKQKHALRAELEGFLGQLLPPKTLSNANPEDLRMFIVHKEGKGRTKLHTNMWEYRGSPGKTACECPCTMAFKSVDSLIGKIRAILRDYGRSGDWNQILGTGNPAAAPLLKRHLQCISAEQASANVVSKQAVPLMFNKLACLCRYLNYKGYTEKGRVAKFLYTRDCAFFRDVRPYRWTRWRSWFTDVISVIRTTR